MFKLNFFKSSKFITTTKMRKTSFFILFLGFLFVMISSYFLYIPQQIAIVDNKLKVGDIIKEEIKIKKDITIEDKESTEQKKKKEIENIIPIYEYYIENETKSRNLLNEWFKSLREYKKSYLKNQNELSNIINNIKNEFGILLTKNDIKFILTSNIFNKIDLDAILKFLKPIYEKRILSSKMGAKKSKQGTIKIVQKKGEPNIKRVEELYDLNEVKIALVKFLKDQKVSIKEIKIISPIIMEFIDINISYSQNLTKIEENRVSSQVNPVLVKLKAGKVILRKGDEIKADDIKIIRLIAKEEKIRGKGLSNFFLIIFVLGFLFIFMERFFKIWKSDNINKDKLYIVTGATITVSAIVYRISLFLFPLILKNISLDINVDTTSIFFIIPFGFGALIIAFIFNLQSAVIFSFINSIIGGIICDWDFKIVLYILIGNLTVSYGIEYFQRLKRSPIFKAVLFWLFPINIIFILLLNLTEPNISFIQILFNFVLGFLSAIISAILVSFVIPLWEIGFNLITELKLIELANLNLPIFREMLEKAPGTYHHSQMVASLSESAAVELDLSPLLLTSMALYHDIGKIENPQFFTENLSIYKSPHDNLSPRESSKNIISHIPDGIERANKIKLPQILKNAINQHHGTKLVRFFYDKAREMSSVDTDEFEDKAFRYQGEKPENIENAIIMLADQVEAASKSLATPTEEEIKNVIQTIVSSNIEENQFDECERLTFKALNTIANSFHKKLSSIYHMRVSYPGFDFKKKEDNDKNNK